MKCPFCGFQEDRVLDSRVIRDGEAIRRRRECLRCTRRYTTYEFIEERRLLVVKKDGRREPFQRAKILNGLQRACQKRPISTETLERIVDDLERELHDRGEVEIPSRVIGERVSEALRALDQVAYVRFASVYRAFEDVGEFRQILDELRRQGRRKGVAVGWERRSTP